MHLIALFLPLLVTMPPRFVEPCGDSWCGETEDCYSCPDDCGPCWSGWCGDGYCSAGETCSSCSYDCGGCVCNGTPGQWDGCRGNGCAVCSERLGQNYPCYFQLHPNCNLNTTCAGQFYTCNANCPAPSTAEACGACDGSPGQWAGCRGNGCAVCTDMVSQYPCYFQNHPTCQPNSTCGGVHYTCNASCPQPTQADTCNAPACSAADGYPVNPSTGQPVCPPYNQPIVFFGAHPDDETIGAAGAIAAAVAEGRTVIVELMSHGEISGARGSLASESSHGGSEGHPGPYNNNLSVVDFGYARVREFQDSLSRLGVAGIRVLDYGDGNLPNHVNDIRARMQWWISRNDAGLSLRATAGDEDHTTGYTIETHPDHRAVHDALSGLSFGDRRWWFVYEYRSGAQTFDEQVILSTGPDGTCTKKLNALDAYRVWNVPYQSAPNGRYAIGWYHSTGDLFWGASSDCSEYWINH